MKIFIWNRVKYLTTREHHEGGLVICASSLEAAREMWISTSSEARDEWVSHSFSKCEALTKTPDRSVNCFPDTEPFICIHPDAGCC